jgi:hypothetical protein
MIQGFFYGVRWNLDRFNWCQTDLLNILFDF